MDGQMPVVPGVAAEWQGWRSAATTANTNETRETGIRSLQATDFFGLLGGKVGKVMLGDEGPSLGLGQQWQPQDV